MKPKKIIFLVGFWPDYETLFFKGLEIEGFCIKIFNPINELSYINKIPRFLRNKIYVSKIKKLVSENKESFFIFQEHRLVVESMLNVGDGRRFALMLRNPISPNDKRTISYLENLREKGFSLWSFDHVDCKKYGLNFYNQFAAEVEEAKKVNVKYDFAFVGRDKGRGAIVIELAEKLKDYGFSVYVDIRGSKKYDQISYIEYLSKICKAKCIIDLVQDGQSGITLRPLEAMLNNRKLITNCHTVKGLDFYHPNNIYVIDGEIARDEIINFMNLKMNNSDDSQVVQYSPAAVINSIVASLI